jgi:hypothetical protein
MVDSEEKYKKEIIVSQDHSSGKRKYAFGKLHLLPDARISALIFGDF